MIRYIVLFLNPAIILTGFYFFFYYEKGIVYLSILSLLTIFFTAKVLAGEYFKRFKLLWFNLGLVYISQLLFLLLLTSSSLRYFLAFILTLLWALIWYLLKQYFDNITDVKNRSFLVVNKFYYYLSFWFLSTSVYALIIFLNLSLFYSILILSLAALLFGLEIISYTKEYPKTYILFVLFSLIQILLTIYLLPINFYIAGTIATLWFFFLIDSAMHKLQTFKLYLALFLLSYIILISSILII